MMMIMWFFILALTLATPKVIPPIKIKVFRPQVTGTGPSFGGFVNSAEDFLNSARMSVFSICGFSTLAHNSSIRYNWTIISQNSDRIFKAEIISERCHLRWRAPFEGKFQIAVSVWDATQPDLTLISAIKNVTIKDIWIVILGDSYASGQGNPDFPVQLFGIVPATWISASCHRSSRSWPFHTHNLIAKQYPDYGILLTYLACSGASISRGILGPGPPDTHLPAQLDVLEEIQSEANEKLCKCDFGNCCPSGRIGPSLLLMSAGGNDVGYAEIIYSLVWGDSARMFKSMPKRLASLKHKYNRLASEITNRIWIKPQAVFFPHYFDITRNEKGEVDANCSELQSISTKDFQRAEQEILGKINGVISDMELRHRWSIVGGVGEIFYKHGYCSSDPYILSVNDSVNRQGNIFGAFHPNERAHIKIAQLVWAKIKGYMERVLM